MTRRSVGFPNTQSNSVRASAGDLCRRRRRRNHDRHDKTSMIRTGNLDRAQRSRGAAASQYVIDSNEWG